MDKDPAAILVDIVRTYMGLTNDQIWQYNNPKVIPNNTGLYVVVHYLTSKPYSTNTDFEVDETDPLNPVGKEKVFVQTKEYFRIEIGSASREANTRKEEIAASMASSYSQTQQETYNFRIFPVSNHFVNISKQEGGSMINRFVVEVCLLACYSYEKNVPFYDQFSATLTPNP